MTFYGLEVGTNFNKAVSNWRQNLVPKPVPDLHDNRLQKSAPFLLTPAEIGVKRAPRRLHYVYWIRQKAKSDKCVKSNYESSRIDYSSLLKSSKQSAKWPLSTIGDRAFPVAAACLWKSLPSQITA